MIQTIPGKIQNGVVVPMSLLPIEDEIRSVSIVLDVEDRTDLEQPRPESSLDFFLGLLEGTDDDEDPIQDYRNYLEKKYL